MAAHERKKRVPAASATARNDSVKILDARPSEFPFWRFSTVDKGGPFAWPKSENTELAIIQKLHEFDSMRWPEIEGADHHSIPANKLSKEAQTRLAEIGQDDVEAIFSFHFGGKQRIIGIRQLGVIKLLWWDPQHLVCPSPLKHT